MKKTLIFMSFFCLSLPAYAGQVTGLWQTMNDSTGKPKSIIRVYEQNGAIYGKVVITYKLDGTPSVVKDANGNAVCDESFRAEKMPGSPSFCNLVLIKGLRLNNRGIFTGGTITNPENNRSYRAEMWLADNGDLIVRGRWGPFGRKQRAHPFTEAQLAELLAAESKIL